MGLFFNVRKPRKFHHDPIYFDPKKDELDERIRKVKREIGELPEEEYKPNLKGSFIDQSAHVKRRQGNEEKSSTARNIRLAVILAILLILLYYFYIR